MGKKKSFIWANMLEVNRKGISSISDFCKDIHAIITKVWTNMLELKSVKV